MIQASPSEPLRVVIVRAMTAIFTYGDARAVIPMIEQLIACCKEKSSVNMSIGSRLAVLESLIAVIRVAGPSCSAIMDGIVGPMSKVVKGNEGQIRAAAIDVLASAMEAVGKSATKDHHSDVLKRVNKGLLDKAECVRVASARHVGASHAVLLVDRQRTHGRSVQVCARASIGVGQHLRFEARRDSPTSIQGHGRCRCLRAGQTQHCTRCGASSGALCHFNAATEHGGQ